MAKFKNKETNEIVEANDFTMLFAYSHNSNYEKIEEKELEKVEDKPFKKKKNDEEESE